MPLAVYLEIGAKRTFAGAVEWPGWCRSGRDETEAIAALLAYAPRYAKVVKTAKMPFAPSADVDVVERLTGGSGTDFGVPSVAPDADERPLTPAELERQSQLWTASWHAFDAALRKATKAGIELRKGPRGGGRDLPKIRMHVLESEEAYLAQLGSKPPRMAGAPVADRIDAIRATALRTLAALARGEPIDDPRQTKRVWSPRYTVRRSAWHALDHAWEIEDRSTP